MTANRLPRLRNKQEAPGYWRLPGSRGVVEARPTSPALPTTRVKVQASASTDVALPPLRKPAIADQVVKNRPQRAICQRDPQVMPVRRLPPPAPRRSPRIL